MATRNDFNVVGVGKVSIVDRSTNPETLLMLPTPSGVTLQKGITETVLETRDEIGQRVVEGSLIDEYKPQLSMAFSALTPQLIATSFGVKLASAESRSMPISRTLKVTNNNKVRAGVGSGEQGNGMPADQATSKMSILGGAGETIPLTRVDTASFDAAGTRSFSQGADAAWQITDDVVGEIVSIDFPHNDPQATAVGAVKLNDIEVRALGVMVNRKRVQVRFPSAEVIVANGDLEFGAGMTLDVRSLFDGQSCIPLEIFFGSEITSC